MILPAEFSSGAPEIFLALAGLFLLAAGVFSKTFSKWMTEFVMAAIAVGLLLVLPDAFGGERVGFFGLFLSNAYTQLSKVLILGAVFFVLLMSLRHLKREGITDFEYSILVLFSTVGMMTMVSANDLMALFIGLELQSLSLYVMVAMHRGRLVAAEGAIKYFALGALSTALLLYGMSLIYGFAGSTEYHALLSVFATDKDLPAFLLVGMALMIVGIGFKISLVPFHMWTPDVYQASSSSVAAFLAAAPKGAAILLFVRVCFEIFIHQLSFWAPILVTLSLLSMVFGSFGALYQKDIKRLLAYSSIAHMGFILLGLIGGDFTGIRNVFIYVALYLVMTIGIFACILSLKKQGKTLERIDDLSGLAREHSLVAGCLTIALFSLAGIPPLAGFMAKLGVFMSAIEAGYYWLAVVGVLASVVAAGYYLRLIKVIYFDEPSSTEGASLAYGESKETTFVMIVMTAIMLFYILTPETLMEPVYKATKSLFFRL